MRRNGLRFLEKINILFIFFFIGSNIIYNILLIVIDYQN